MSAILVCSRVFSPWRSEAATSAAAWVSASGAEQIAVIRADLDGSLPRETPRPAIDARLSRTASLPATSNPPRSWEEISSAARAAVTTALSWTSAADHGGGAQPQAVWEAGYSGPVDLADHVAMALLRHRGLVGRWSAHLIASPEHDETGKRVREEVTPGPLTDALVRLLGSRPPSDAVADWVMALVAGADEVVVPTQEAADYLRERFALEASVWARPGALAAPGYDSARRPGICAVVDPAGLPMLAPVLTAYASLSRQEQEALPLRLLTNAPEVIAPELRRRGLEARVSLGADRSPPERERSAWALVLDRPRPEGLEFSPFGLPSLADHAAAGTPVILLAEQDSPLTSLPVAHHLPAGHVTAALALLRRLAATPSPA